MPSFSKYHGVVIDDNLNFKSHIEYLATKTTRYVVVLSKLRFFFNSFTLFSILPYSLYHLILFRFTYFLSETAQGCIVAVQQILHACISSSTKAFRINFLRVESKFIPKFRKIFN